MVEQANIFAYIALFGWIPLVLGLFSFLPPRRAVIYGYLIAWLFLPMAHVRVHGLTDYNKMSAAGFGVLISAMIFDSKTVFAFRPRLWDLPMLVWCLCPLFSSLDNAAMDNDLGWYDGIVSSVYQATMWGIPYFVGRIYFNDLEGLRELAMGIVWGGLVYTPLCWFEIRFSPQLHLRLYGFNPSEFIMSIRGGGYRPMVFMQHGLAVGMWMSAAAVTAFWLYMSGIKQRIFGIGMGWAFIILTVTSYYCHSLGATVLMFVGLAILAATYVTKWPVWVLMLAMVPSVYMVIRTEHLWSGEGLVDEVTTYSVDRAKSLKVRLRSEDILLERVMEQPWFGWGGWDRFRAKDDGGHAMGIPDALWIITFGHNGIVGVVAMTLSLLLPVLLLAYKIPIRFWVHPGAAPPAAIAILLSLYMVDNLMNAMVNPIYVLGAGGICGLAFSMRQSQMAMPAVPSRMTIVSGGGFGSGTPPVQARPSFGPAAVPRLGGPGNA